MNPYSAYDYLAYVIPGGTVLVATQLALAGWPSSEPGNAGLVALLAAAFLLGHGAAALAAFVEPLVWGHRPGAPVSPLWGLDGPGGVYDSDEIEMIRKELASRYGSELGLRRLYQLAYTELQQRGKDQRLMTLNSQIGFHRNSAAALAIAADFTGFGHPVSREMATPFRRKWPPCFTGNGHPLVRSSTAPA